MTLLNTINVGGTDYGITGAAVLGSCATPAGSEIKVCTFSDSFQLKAGIILLVKFTYANTYGDGSTTYPKLQVNGTNYIMRRADGNYLQSGEWNNNATLTFLFDGTDFILPAGSGSGNGGSIPLGIILAIHSNQVPDGYLPCNGVQFDTAQFAALYALLGIDHTPDLREVTLRGIGHNGTYVFDSTETDPSTGLAGTQNHDEYTLGEFKDDQLQDHGHKIKCGTVNYPAGIMDTVHGSDALNDTYVTDVTNGRHGTVTRGKSVGVNYIIKATSGLPDDQQDYILNQITGMVEGDLSYSTEETLTGGKWIDGKPIYRKTIPTELTSGSGYLDFGALNIPNLGIIINAQVTRVIEDGYQVINTGVVLYNGHIEIEQIYTGGASTCYLTLEYTKATPST